MKKRAIFLIVLIIIFGVGISFFMYYIKIVDKPRNPLKNKGFRRITGEKYY